MRAFLRNPAIQFVLMLIGLAAAAWTGYIVSGGSIIVGIAFMIAFFALVVFGSGSDEHSQPAHPKPPLQMVISRRDLVDEHHDLVLALQIIIDAKDAATRKGQPMPAYLRQQIEDARALLNHLQANAR